jgi:hypothetical protein
MHFWAGRVTQVVEFLPSMHEVLSSNPSTTIKKKKKCNQVLVAHTCNPCYSGGRNQEDCGQSQPRHVVRGVAQGEALSSSPSTAKKKMHFSAGQQGLHTCNPNYLGSGSGYWEDHNSRPA